MHSLTEVEHHMSKETKFVENSHRDMQMDRHVDIRKKPQICCCIKCHRPKVSQLTLSLSFDIMTEQCVFEMCLYAPGSNYWGLFVLSLCLLSTLIFVITFELIGDRDFIFCICTNLMMPFQMRPRTMTLTLVFVLKNPN